MPWYPRIEVALKRVLPLLLSTQASGYVSALLVATASTIPGRHDGVRVIRFP
jgi:hypothetical protein